MRQKILAGVALTLGVGLLTMFSAVEAQSTTAGDYAGQLQQVTDETDELQTELRDDGARSCQLTAVHLNGLVEQAKLTLNYRTEVYQVVIEQANQLAITRETNDLPADDLRTGIAELSDRVTDFTTNYAQYQAELQEAANIACNEQTELRATVSRALSALRTAKFQAEQVEEYAQDDFSNLLQDLEAEDE